MHVVLSVDLKDALSVPNFCFALDSNHIQFFYTKTDDSIVG
jgi:hypothetical protein